MTTSIETARLYLRLLTDDDVGDVFAYASDPEVARNTAWFAHRSLDDSRDYVAFVVGADSDVVGSLRHVWGIRLDPRGPVLGTIDLVQDSESVAHIDFALARPYWNRGIVTEATEAVMHWAFRRLPSLQEIRSGGLSRNAGTMRVLEKLGFEIRARTNVPRPPKFATESLEATHFSIRRDAFYETHPREAP